MSVRLNTIGFAGKTLQQFVELLRAANVSKVIDTRLRPDTQLSAFARKRDLPYVLQHLADAEYEHRSELAPTPEILDEFRRTKDWDTYISGFNSLIAERDTSAALHEAIDGHDSVALLCSEADPLMCHRRLLAEDYVRRFPDVEIRDLV